MIAYIVLIDSYQYMKNYRLLGLFSLFALFAVPGILEGEWGQAIWLVWVVWAIFFFVDPTAQKNDEAEKNKDDNTGA